MLALGLARSRARGLSGRGKENDVTDRYDVVVLGAGSTGTNVAWYARDNGLSCAIVEEDLVGGECSYWACIPSKALLGPPHALAGARRLPGAAEAATGPLDVQAVLRWRDAFISRRDDGPDDDGQAGWVTSVGADLVRGHGRIVGEREVEVTAADGQSRRLHAARAVVVATGTRPAMPPVTGLADTRFWTTREATVASAVPARLLVLGGGVAGSELAQAYRRLGAQVTVVETVDRLLGSFEPWAGAILAEAFAAESIDVRTGRSATAVEREGTDGPVSLHLDDGSTLVGDELLVAAGRRFNTDDVGLDAIGLDAGGPLQVDDRLRVRGVAGDWLYAAGDVNGRVLLTHQGKYHGRLIGDLVAGKDREAWADHKAVPQVVFTDPEVAAVGVTEQQAVDEGIDVKAVSYDIGNVAGARLAGDDVRGRAQLVIDQRRRVIVGATFVGPHAGELLHAATIAVVGEVPIETLWHAVPAFPTVSEVWLRLLEADRGL
jgi:pyruvate/2-oxoglutarate dehydrogenase complex dihydrolipoamide dehydrogenase (E3) component